MHTLTSADIRRAFCDQPVLLAPEYADDVLTAEQEAREVGVFGRLLARMVPDALIRDSVQQHEADRAMAYGFNDASPRKPFAFADGLAFISITGLLMARYSWSDSWATGYDYIRRRFEAAVADPDVKGIVLDVDSGGGQVAGNFDLAQMIYDSRGKKPSMAIVNGAACSGAYSLASATDKIVASSASRVGSIGVVMMHVSYEENLKKNGVEVTFLYAGKHKIDGNAYQALSDETKDRWQASVDKSYTQFVDLVARNRGLEATAVRSTEAMVYEAEDAKAQGLIDAIMLPEEAVAAFRKELSGSVSTNTNGSTNMSTNENTPDAAAANAAASQEAVQKAVEQERQRTAAILSCEEAKGRETLAQTLVANGIAADVAKTILAAAPKAEPAANTFNAAMEATGSPNVGNGAEGSSSEPSISDRILRNFAAATGFKPRAN
jgi:signal peptide peptidase SppA